MYAKLIVQKVSSVGLAIKNIQSKTRLKIILNVMALSLFLLVGSPSLFAQTGGALNYDGTSDKVNIPNSGNVFDFTTGTVEAWVKPSASSNNKSILAMRSAGNVRWSVHFNQSSGSIGIYNGTKRNSF
jgi:hypothetical protein